MQDRPTFDELLAAVEYFLDNEIVPNVPGARGFHARVSAHAISIVRRELELEDETLAREWAGLDTILRSAERPQGRVLLRAALRERNEELCSMIRSGEADESDAAGRVFGHLKAVLREKIRVSDPELLARSEANAALDPDSS